MASTQPRDISDLIATGTVRKPDRRLDQEAKEKLANDGTVLVVNAVHYGADPTIGEYWSVEALAGDEPVQFNIGSHPRRDTFMQSLSIALGDGPITGLRLVAYPGRNGNAFVSLEPAT